MKNINVSINIGLVLLLVVFLYGCQSYKNPYVEEAQKLTAYLTETNHPIRKMQNKTTMQQNVNSSNFFLLSNTSMSNTAQPVVIFSFLDSISQMYSMISVPLSMVKMAFSSDSIPSVKFVFKKSLYQFFLHKYEGLLYTDMFEDRVGYISPNEVFVKKQQAIFNGYLSYMVINCRESDWPSNIELPLNKAE